MSKPSKSRPGSPKGPGKVGDHATGPLGHSGSDPASTPGYAEQHPPDRATAQQPGARRSPHSEEAGVERDVDSEAGADADGEREES